MSDEADRRRTYRELEKRGQPTPENITISESLQSFLQRKRQNQK